MRKYGKFFTDFFSSKRNSCGEGSKAKELYMFFYLTHRFFHFLNGVNNKKVDMDNNIFYFHNLTKLKMDNSEL